MEIEVRTLKPADAPAVAELLQGQREDYARGFRPFAFDEDAIRDALFHADMDVYQGVWFDNVLMGIVMLRGWDEGFDVPALGILVDEAYAGTGVADAAMRLILTTARYRGARRVMLHCDLENRRGRRCFERHGFAQMGDPFDGRVRMEAIIVGVYEAETDLRTLYDPDAATVQRSIYQEYGFAVSERFARDFAAFAQARAEELA